jgi:serine/threonine protein kinase
MNQPPTRQPTDLSAVAPPPAASELQERLRAATSGEYEILGELGSGGMATVYLAHEISLDRKVAIKVMSPAMISAPGLVERFKREARTAANLSHPNIIPIYSVREVDGLLFCVIKLVQGTPLESIMRELGQLPIAMVQAILAQVGDAMGYAHRHGVIHRDIKPGNILIDDDGWAVVTDFGIAKVPEMEGLTVTGVAVGTPTYMSPEQCSGDAVSGASDQYSLGVVAYEMLAGRPPFTATTMMALMYSHFHDTPPPLETLRPDCPPELRDAVMRMLHKDPAARWPSMEAAVDALGAKPLARDDPTRSHLISLARTGATHRIVSQIHTPRSPIPLTHRRSGEAAPVAAPRWRPVFMGAAAMALLGVGYLIAQLATPDRAAPPATVGASAAADSAPAVAVPPPQQVVEQPQAPVRKPAPTSLTLPKAASDPPPTRQSAVVAPPPVVRRDSVVLSQATPTRAESAAVAISTPALRQTVDSTTRAAARPNTVIPPVASEADDVRALILSFASALAASDLAAARRLYPSMPADQRQGFEALWRDGGTMTPRWTVSDIVVDGTTATARVRGSNLVTLRRGAPSEVPVALRARLERRNGEWRLTALIN